MKRIYIIFIMTLFLITSVFATNTTYIIQESSWENSFFNIPILILLGMLIAFSLFTKTSIIGIFASFGILYIGFNIPSIQGTLTILSGLLMMLYFATMQT